MMDEISVFSYVEDKPSREILIKLVERHNQTGSRIVSFHPGFPKIENGYGNIKSKCSAFLSMAGYTLVLTDLDTAECPATLIGNWFFQKKKSAFKLPPQVIFRVAVREIEAWLMADKDEFANFLGISPGNFDDAPEMLSDPKRFLLNAINRKARKKKIRAMLPKGSASIGPEYNENLCEFIKTRWSIDRAKLHAPSLQRALSALGRV